METVLRETKMLKNYKREKMWFLRLNMCKNVEYVKIKNADT